MRGAVFHGAGDVRLEEVPDAPPPGAGEVRLRPLLVGLCGTDAAEFTSGPHFVPLDAPHPRSGHGGPTVLGHEILGVVADAGDDVDLAVGARVVAGAGVWCGGCDACRRGRTNLCERYHTVGLHRHGGLADRVTVPAAMCVSVPDGLGDVTAALAQPLAVAAHAADRGRIAEGRPVVVVGAGAIGSLIVVVGRARGAEPIVAIDPSAAARARARTLGAHVVLDPSRDDLTAAVAEAVGDPSVVVEASGTAAGLRTALALVPRGGRVLLVGLHDDPRPIDLFTLALDEVDLVTTVAHVCERDLPAAVDILTRVDVRALVDRVVPLDDVVRDALVPMRARALVGKALVRVSP